MEMGPKLYRHNFTDGDFHSLAQRLARVKGKFVLSLNDRPEVRETFSRFHIRREEIAYTAQVKPHKRYGELLIMNFIPQPEFQKPRLTAT